jgi:hypothetical protein
MFCKSLKTLDTGFRRYDGVELYSFPVLLYNQLKLTPMGFRRNDEIRPFTTFCETIKSKEGLFLKSASSADKERHTRAE